MLSAAAGLPDRQRISEVPGFDLAPGEHQDDGVGDGGAEALGHWGTVGLGGSR